jgi:hypothetical protein
MNAIKFCLVLGALAFSFAVRSQTIIDPAIQAKLNAFIGYSNNKEWDKAFDLIYPKLFTKIAKQDLVDMMVSMEADGMSLNMGDARITSSSSPMTEGNETFVRVEYTSNLTVKIKPAGLYDAPKAIQAIEEQFIAAYGKSNVKWDESRKEFRIIANKSMLAIDSGNKDWKLLEINMDQPELMEYLFSPAILDELVRVD